MTHTFYIDATWGKWQAVGEIAFCLLRNTSSNTYSSPNQPV